MNWRVHLLSPADAVAAILPLFLVVAKLPRSRRATESVRQLHCAVLASNTELNLEMFDRRRPPLPFD